MCVFEWWSAWRASAAGWRTRDHPCPTGDRAWNVASSALLTQLAGAFPRPAKAALPRHLLFHYKKDKNTIVNCNPFPNTQKQLPERTSKSPLIISALSLAIRSGIWKESQMHLNGRFQKIDTLRMSLFYASLVNKNITLAIYKSQWKKDHFWRRKFVSTHRAGQWGSSWSHFCRDKWGMTSDWDHE